MRITFATSQTLLGSTVAGRIMPLAQVLAHKHEVSLLVLALPKNTTFPANIKAFAIGHEPFKRTAQGKRRLKGLQLIFSMLTSALRTTFTLFKIKPEVVIMVKPLPVTVLGTYLYRLVFRKTRIVLDADDFELTANVLTSMMQRAAIHAAERLAVRISGAIVVATPFLLDHFGSLAQSQTPLHLLPTGITVPPKATPLPQAPTVAYLGSLSVSSGHRIDLLPTIFEKVLKEIPAAKFLLAGDGDDAASLKQELQKRNLLSSVTWHGRFSLDEIPDLISPLTVVLDPIDASITQRAKSSFRALAALAYGRAIVTSNIGIRSQLVPPEFHSRAFATPNRPEEYAACVIAWLKEPLTTTEQETLHTYAQQFSWTTLAQQYEHIITSL